MAEAPAVKQGPLTAGNFGCTVVELVKLGTHVESGTYSASLGLVTTGLPRLDAILHGGLPPSSIVAITGLPGSGKTILALQILAYHARQGHKGIYFSTAHQPAKKVLEYYEDLSFWGGQDILGELTFDDLGPMLQRGNLTEALNLMIRNIQDRGAATIALDGVRPLSDLAESSAQLWTFLEELGSHLSKAGCLGLLVGENLLPEDMKLPVFTVADVIIYLEVEHLVRSDVRILRVYKNRSRAYEEGRHAFKLTNDGIRFIGPSMER